MQTLSDEVLKLSVKYILLTSKIRCNGLELGILYKKENNDINEREHDENFRNSCFSLSRWNT